LEEKTFTRASDLVVHCQKRHYIEMKSLPKSFLGVRNCFYMSIYPRDYARIVTPEPFSSNLAIEARRLIIKRLGVEANAGARLELWRTGWRDGMKVSESRGKAGEEKKEIKTSGEDKENTRPKEKVEKGDDKPKLKTVKNGETKMKVDKEQDKKKETQGETPLDLSLSKQEENVVSESNEMVTEKEGQTIKCEMKKRKECCVDLEENLSVERVEDKVDKNKKIKTVFREITGNENEVIVNITKKYPDELLIKREAVMKVRRLSESSSSTEGSNEDNGTELDEKGTASLESVKGEEETTKCQELGSSQENEKAASYVTKNILKYSHASGRWSREIIKETVKENQVDQGNIDSKEHVNIQMKENMPLPDDISSDNTAPTGLLDYDSQQASYRGRATDLLLTGAMPMLPPGRRDWKEGHSFHLNLFGYNFMWPPEHWNSMSKDRRMMAWEQVAFGIECAKEGSIGVQTSRSFLLDKYNFLALPGSGSAKRETNERGASNARYHLYQMLRSISQGKPASDCEIQQIACMETIRKEGDLEKQLRSIQVPLRL
jgi:hypothetical protein